MKPGIVIPARGTSLRLPKKHFRALGGEYLIDRLVGRLGSTWPIVIATVPGYVEMREWAVKKRMGLFFDGALAEDDVTARVYGAAWGAAMDPVVIVQGDSPFIDAGMVRDALAHFKAAGLDLLWNTSPSGFRWRIVSQRVLKAAATPREHVLGSFITAWPLRAQATTYWLSSVKLSIDTKEDLEFANEVGKAASWGTPHAIIAEALRHRPDVRSGDAT